MDYRELYNKENFTESEFDEAVEKCKISNPDAELSIPIGITETGVAHITFPETRQYAAVNITGDDTTGKTTLLSNIIRMAAETYDSDEVEVIAIDGGTSQDEFSDLVELVNSDNPVLYCIKACESNDFYGALCVVESLLEARLSICKGFGGKSIKEYNKFISDYEARDETIKHIIFIVDNLRDGLDTLNEEQRAAAEHIIAQLMINGRKANMSLIMVNSNIEDDLRYIIETREIPGYATLKDGNTLIKFRFPTRK